MQVTHNINLLNYTFMNGAYGTDHPRRLHHLLHVTLASDVIDHNLLLYILFLEYFCNGSHIVDLNGEHFVTESDLL